MAREERGLQTLAASFGLCHRTYAPYTVSISLPQMAWRWPRRSGYFFKRTEQNKLQCNWNESVWAEDVYLTYFCIYANEKHIIHPTVGPSVRTLVLVNFWTVLNQVWRVAFSRPEKSAISVTFLNITARYGYKCHWLQRSRTHGFDSCVRISTFLPIRLFMMEMLCGAIGTR